MLDGEIGRLNVSVEAIILRIEQAILSKPFVIENCGIQIVSGPQVRPDGANQVYIYDPDRHLIEICS